MGCDGPTGTVPTPLLWRRTWCGAPWCSDRHSHRPEWRSQRRRHHLDVPPETPPGVVGWATLRCQRCGLHLEAYAQPQVLLRWQCPGSEPKQLTRYLNGPSLDHVPPQAALCTFPRTVDRWLQCPFARAPFQRDGPRGDLEIGRSLEPEGGERP